MMRNHFFKISSLLPMLGGRPILADRCELSSLSVRLSTLLVVFAVLLLPRTSHAQEWLPESPVDSPSARSFFTMAADTSQGHVVLFGGLNATGVLDHTFVWNDANWTQQNPAHSPPKRFLASMAFDAADGKVVLFGGGNSASKLTGTLSDTWVWNGTDWKEEHPAKSPSARGYAGMAYDAADGNVVLFGGDTTSSGTTALSDTWVWNGSDWKKEHPAESPSARALPSMAYDAAAGKVVLFGGFDSSGTLSDTWVWNGSDWKQEHPANSPPARASAAMAYDEAQGQVVLFGGLDSTSNLLRDTWVWNGTDWTEEDFEHPPVARFGAGLAFDAAEGQLVLFGGLSTDEIPAPVLSDTWVKR
jgi:Galactose oxidase, central domain